MSPSEPETNCNDSFPTKKVSALTSNILGLVLNLNEPFAPEPLYIIKPNEPDCADADINPSYPTDLIKPEPSAPAPPVSGKVEVTPPKCMPPPIWSPPMNKLLSNTLSFPVIVILVP